MVEGTRRVPLDTAPYQDCQLTDSTPLSAARLGRLLALSALAQLRHRTSASSSAAGVVRHNFGFRKQPYRSRWRFRAGYATGAETVPGRVPAATSAASTRACGRPDLLRASGIEVVRFFGFGNETPRID